MEFFSSLINKLQEEIDTHGARPAVMDDLISRVMEHHNEEVIPRLLLFLRDAAEYREGMYSILHAAESFPKAVYIEGYL